MEDIGSWVLMSRAPTPYVGDPAEATESWYGLSKDLDKLPHTGGTGSTAYCIDNGAFYMYERTTDQWYPQ